MPRKPSTALAVHSSAPMSKPYPRAPKEGTRVVFRPSGASLALYSHPPQVGEAGVVTAVNLGGGKRRTFMPGPGGGLLYVKWDHSHMSNGVSLSDVRPEPSVARPGKSKTKKSARYGGSALGVMPKEDRRYTIQPEFTGHAEPQYVVRFMGTRVGAANEREAAVAIAKRHEAARQHQIEGAGYQRRENPAALNQLSPKQLKALGAKMHNWHASMGDPIYAAGSYYYSGKRHPSIETENAALENINMLLARETDPENRAELLEIKGALEPMLIEHIWQEGERKDNPRGHFIDVFLGELDGVFLDDGEMIGTVSDGNVVQSAGNSGYVMELDWHGRHYASELVPYGRPRGEAIRLTSTHERKGNPAGCGCRQGNPRGGDCHCEICRSKAKTAKRGHCRICGDALPTEEDPSSTGRSMSYRPVICAHHETESASAGHYHEDSETAHYRSGNPAASRATVLSYEKTGECPCGCGRPAVAWTIEGVEGYYDAALPCGQRMAADFLDASRRPAPRKGNPAKKSKAKKKAKPFDEDKYFSCAHCSHIGYMEDSWSPGDMALCDACDTEVTGRPHKRHGRPLPDAELALAKAHFSRQGNPTKAKKKPATSTKSQVHPALQPIAKKELGRACYEPKCFTAPVHHPALSAGPRALPRGR